MHGTDAGTKAPTLRDAVFSFELKPGAVSADTGAERAWSVLHFEAHEGVSQCWECNIELVSDDGDADPTLLVDRYAALTITRPATDEADARGGVARTFAGVVRRAVRATNAEDAEHARVFRAHVTLVPALWKLAQETDCRIFQNVTAVEVVQHVLARAGLYAGRVEAALRGRYLPRECCIQYNESSLNFVSRLQDEGIAHFFLTAGHDETLVLTDHADAYAPAPTLDGAASVAMDDAVQGTAVVETLQELAWTRHAPAPAPYLRDYDFTQPEYEFSAPHNDPELRARHGLEFEYPAGAVNAGYDPASRQYLADNLANLARVRREQGLSRAVRGHGRSNATGFAAGCTFVPDEYGRIARVAPPFLLVAADHVGTAPEVLPIEQRAGEHREAQYTNRFECTPLREVPADGRPLPLPFRPPRTSPRPVMHGLHSAVVVADPTAQSDDIALDEYGRIRVRFHWDQQAHGLHGSDRGASSCWIRTMQPWAGMGFGSVFVPRVGMEVVVSFVDGNPDAPVVLGCLYNGTNRPPTGGGAAADLRREATRSMLRTRSSPGGEGFNEISFDDAAGHEELSIQAERDLNELVKRDHTTTVKGDRTLIVEGAGRTRHGGDREATIGGSDTRTVHEDAATHVLGSHEERVEGGSRVRVEGARHETFESTVFRDVRQSETVRVGANLDLEVTGDQRSVTRGRQVALVDGPHTAVFRAGAAVSSIGPYAVSAARMLTLSAGEGLRLICGESVIDLAPDEVLITSPRIRLAATELVSAMAPDVSLHLESGKATLDAKTEARIAAQRVKAFGKDAELELDAGEVTAAGKKAVGLYAESASLELDRNAALGGTKVQLQSTAGAKGAYEDPAPDKLATSWLEIALVRKTPRPDTPDAMDDLPVPGARYVVEAAHGRVYTGVLDGEGRARVLIPPGAARVRFPDFDGDAIGAQ